MDSEKNVGSVLKRLRRSKGLTLQQLADIFLQKYRAGTSKSIISLWENNKANPSFNSLSMYTDYFGVSLDYIKGNSETQRFDDSVVDRYYVDTSMLNSEQKLELNIDFHLRYIQVHKNTFPCF